MSGKGEDKHKRRETKSKMGETVCSGLFTISHFLGKKINLASESTGIVCL